MWSSFKDWMSQSSAFKSGAKLLFVGAAAVAVAAVSLSLVQHKLIYMPRVYDNSYYVRVLKAAREKGVVQLPFSTAQGAQQAFLLPATNTQSPHQRLWLLFGGNAGLALDWWHAVDRFLTVHPAHAVNTSFLLIDYPGYGGANQGKPSPASLVDTAAAAQQAASAYLRQHKGIEPQRIKVGLLGHSLGSAVALQYAAHAATDTHVDSIVLLSPFSSMLEMAHTLIGRLPLLHLLLQHDFDNERSLQQFNQRLQTANTPTSLVIIHGRQDGIVPVRMGRKLAELARSAAVHTRTLQVQYHEVDSDHNDIMFRAEELLFRSMILVPSSADHGHSHAKHTSPSDQPSGPPSSSL